MRPTETKDLVIALSVLGGLAIIVALVMGIWAFIQTQSLQNQMTVVLNHSLPAVQASLLVQSQGLQAVNDMLQSVPGLVSAQGSQLARQIAANTSQLQNEINPLKDLTRLSNFQQALSAQIAQENTDKTALQAWLLLLSGLGGSVQPQEPRYGFVQGWVPDEEYGASCARICNNLEQPTLSPTPGGQEVIDSRTWQGITSIPNTYPINNTCLCYEDARYPQGTITTNNPVGNM